MNKTKKSHLIFSILRGRFFSSSFRLFAISRLAGVSLSLSRSQETFFSSASTVLMIFHCTNPNSLVPFYKQIICSALDLRWNRKQSKPFRMDARRHTATYHPTATFSIVAHEALDHFVAETDQDEPRVEHGRPLTHQRSRRRLGVSENSLTLPRSS